MAQLLRMDEEGTTYIRTDGVLHFNGNGTHPPTKHLGSDRAQGVSGTGSRRPVSSFQAAAQYLLDGTGPLQPENLVSLSVMGTLCKLLFETLATRTQHICLPLPQACRRHPL